MLIAMQDYFSQWAISVIFTYSLIYMLDNTLEYYDAFISLPFAEAKPKWAKQPNATSTT